MLEGFSCTIFAYGQTSTGKTFTMEGARNSKTNEIIEHQAGVIPRSVAHIFETLENNRSEYTVKLSCLELYNEELQDLLSPDPLAGGCQGRDSMSISKLKIFDDASKGTSVHGAEEVIVQDTAHVMKILDQAAKKRQIAETQLNKQSSRSHAITTITIHIRDQTPDGEEFIKTGKLNLVDLAGSENIGRSGAQNKRAKEAGMINQSLLTLGRVITALTEKCPHVPYRESKLTRLLQDSLGGKTKTCIVATISPSVLCLEETMSTLDYANRAKSIKNKPELNMKISKGAMIKEMASECEQLRQMLLMQRNKSGGVFLTNEQFEEKEKLIRVQEDKIETMKTEMDIMKNDYNNALEQIHEEQEKLRAEKDEHFMTRSELDSTKQVVERQSEEISSLNEQLSEVRYVLSKKESSEKQLHYDANLLLANLAQSETDVVQLVDSVDNQRDIHNTNEENVSSTSDRLTKQVLEVLKSFESFRQSYDKIAKADFQRHFDSFQEARTTAFADLLEKNLGQLSGEYNVTKDKISSLAGKYVSEYNKMNQESMEKQTKFEEMLDDCVQVQLSIAQKTLKNIQNEFESYHVQGIEWVKTFILNNIIPSSKQLVEKYVEEHGKLIQETLKKVFENTSSQIKILDQHKHLFLELLAKQQSSNTTMKQQLLSKVEQLVNEYVANNNNDFSTTIHNVEKGLSGISDQVQLFKSDFMEDSETMANQCDNLKENIVSLIRSQTDQVQERYNSILRMKEDHSQNINILSKMLTSQSDQFLQHMQTQAKDYQSVIEQQNKLAKNLNLDTQLVHERHTRSFEEGMQSTRDAINNLDQNVISTFANNMKDNNMNALNINSRILTAGEDSHKYIQQSIEEMKKNWRLNIKTNGTPPRKRKRTSVDIIAALRTYDEIARERQGAVQQVVPNVEESEAPVISDAVNSEDQENKAPASPINNVKSAPKMTFGPQKQSVIKKLNYEKPATAPASFSPQNGKRRRKQATNKPVLIPRINSSSQFR